MREEEGWMVEGGEGGVQVGGKEEGQEEEVEGGKDDDSRRG